MSYVKSASMWLSVTEFFLFYSSKDEQERVQKKTFVNWINSYLSKVNILVTVCYKIHLIFSMI